MKKSKILGLITLLMILTNCSSNDDDKPTEISYAGNWVATKFLIEKPYDLNNDGIKNTDYKVELPCLIQDFDLKKDGTGLFKANIHGIVDSKVTCVEYIEIALTWKVNEDKTKITITIRGEQGELDIIDENSMEYSSESLLDSEIGIPGKVIYERK